LLKVSLHYVERFQFTNSLMHWFSVKQVDGQAVDGLGLSKVRGFLLGPSGTVVILQLLSAETKVVYETAIKREAALNASANHQSADWSPSRSGQQVRQ
jgi:hypothetical protein